MKRNSAILAVLILTVVSCARGQITRGETSLNLNGTVSAGYTDDQSNQAGSDHSIFGGGTADLSGSYFNPNFLSFDIQPFYNQSRVNSNFQSLTNSSGVTASAQVFGGSIFPGSVSYSSAFNSSGNFMVPGLANYTTHGNNDVFVVNWGVHAKDLPTLNFNFSNSNNSYSIYGANGEGALHSNNFSVTSAYELAGFNLSGGYQYTGSQTRTPEFLIGQTSQNADSGANAYSFGVGHTLPWNGSFTAAATRLSIKTNFGDSTFSDRYNTNIDTLTSGVTFLPRAHLTVGGNTFYTDNLEGTLYNTLLTAGVNVPQNQQMNSSHDLSLTGFANYEMPAEHLNLHAYAERQQQNFLGISFAANSYNGMASYSNKVLGGSLNAVLGLTRTSIEPSGQSMLGVNTSFNYSHQIHQWTFAGGFGYSQDSQTVLIAYTTSGFNYSGSVGRRLGRKSYWGAYVSGSKSVLTDQPGSANSSESFSSSFSVARFSLNGTYSQTSGNALLTATGLSPTPVPLPVVNPLDVVFFNGKSYSAGIGAHPLHGLTLTAMFAKALSGTENGFANSNNSNENLNFMATYNVRKLSFIAGYSRLVQGFSLSGGPPAMVGSFYVGISRYFNFF